MKKKPDAPLAERMRPLSLDDYVGQEHLVGPTGVVRKLIERGTIPSMILWGPPGVGKTTLAEIIAHTVQRPFYRLSAISSGVKDVREVIQSAQKGGMFQSARPILFVDEIHRFSKSQQDSLLGAVEKGTVTLVGATTENPSFEVIPALLSRCQTYVLQPLGKEHLQALLERALKEDAYLQEQAIRIEEENQLFRFSGGDARKLLNVLELVTESIDEQDAVITDDRVLEILQNNIQAYDKTGEWHYDVISAFIKSIRGSDPNAGLYWLARMIEGGEDPKFIARRIVILAAEDIGLANPTALVIANACFQSVETLGYPECRIPLAQAVIYLATSPKSNSAYMGIKRAQKQVKETGNLPVPLHLRNAPTQLMKELGYGEQYRYAHDFEQNFIDQEYLPDEISGQSLYEPASNSREQQLRQFLGQRWKGKYGYE